MPDFDLNMDAPPTDEPEVVEEPTPEATLPEALRGKTPEQIAAELDATAQRAAAAEESAQRAQDLANRIAMGAFDQNRGTPTPDTPDDDADPDDPTAASLKAIRAELESFKTQGQQQLAQTQTLAAQSEYNRQRDHMRMNPDLYPNYGELEDDVEKILGQYAPAQQAAPEARYNVYTYVLGQKAVEERREQSKRVQATMGAGGRSSPAAEPTSAGPSNTKLTNHQKSFAAREGMAEGMFAEMAGPGVMGIDEFNGLKAKHTKKGA